MAESDSSARADQLWMPPYDAFPGEHTMIYRESQTRQLASISMLGERRTFKVRAIITDQALALGSSLEDVLNFQPKNRVQLPDGPFSIWKHYGGTRAVFHDFKADSEGNLVAIEVDVSAIRPELGLAYGRAAVNQLLDSLTASAPHPLLIQRLELMSPSERDVVLAYQVTMPYQSVTQLRKFGGIGPTRWFAGVEAVLREAATNPSPYYRLMLAYRGFEGTKRLQREFGDFVKKHRIDAPQLTPLQLDRTEMARAGFREPVLSFKLFQELIDNFRELRDAAAHFFLGSRGKGARRHLQFSSTLAHTYAKVSALMLMCLRREFEQLKGYHLKFIAPVLNRGMILPMESARHRYIVVCPDDEATAPPDEFN
jgi:hypothetical protein